jgi:hypothetical protein
MSVAARFETRILSIIVSEMNPLITLLLVGLFLARSSSVMAEERIDYGSRRLHEARIEEMRKSGESQPRIISEIESFQALEAGLTLASWTQWTNYYKAKVLNPPISFGNLDPYKMDFTTPTSAYRSYKRAVILLDEPTLLKYADESGTDFLKKGTLAYAKREAGKLPPIVPTRVTLLLTAEVAVNGKDYVMVLEREHNAQNPTNSPVFLQQHFFVHDKQRNAYLFTRDVEFGTFANLLPAAKAAGAGIAKYGIWMDRMKKSQFPPHFYEIK